MPLTPGADFGRAGGDFQRHCGEAIDPIDCRVVGSFPVDPQPGGGSQWRLCQLSGVGAPISGPGIGLAARNHRLVRCPRLRSACGREAARGLVAEQIAGWMKRTYPEDKSVQVSHETIYRSLFIQARGALKKELAQYLRSRRTIRRSRHASRKGHGKGQIADIVSIRERPVAVEDRAVPGHWEGDLIAGSTNSYIATLVERHSRYVMLAKVASKETETVVSTLIQQARQLPTELYKSLTWDRGLEMADHKRFTLATDIDVYFCDPKSPWQRGSNENTNGLLRYYFPKRTDLSVHSQEYLDQIARQLNERPRKTLEFETPAERFNAVLSRVPVDGQS